MRSRRRRKDHAPAGSSLASLSNCPKASRKTFMPDTEPLLFSADSILDTVREPMLILSADLRVRKANRSFYKTFKVTPEETVDRLVYDLGNQQWDIPWLRKLL